MERRVVSTAVSAYWAPPFLGTLITWLMMKRTTSIQDIAAANEKPATIAFNDWVSSSWVTRVTVLIASFIVSNILYPTKIIYSGNSSSLSNFLYFVLTFFRS